MSQVVIELPDDIAARLAEKAQRDHTTPEEIAAHAIASLVAPRRSLPFASLGASGTHDTAENAEELLKDGFGD